MARIVVDIQNIPGESELSGYEDHLDAVSIRETVEIPLSKARSGAGGGNARHSDILLTRVRDRGSPKLAEACSAGTNLGEVVIRLCRAREGGMEVYMTYTLGAAYVSRYESDTADDQGLVYMPHFGPPGQPPAPSEYGIASLLEPPLPEKVRLSPRPMTAQPRGVAGNRDVERVWFNAATVQWLYTGHLDNVLRQWSMKTHRPL